MILAPSVWKYCDQTKKQGEALLTVVMVSQISDCCEHANMII
jgi:hypothetical protein